jgi:YVTN family beta-propeller protein
MLEFRILGPLEVVEGTRPVALGGAKQRALLAVLILHRREVVSTDRLIDELWAERPPATAAKTLQVYVSHLRKALGPDVVSTHGHGYMLAVAADRVDADRFDALAAEGRRALEAGEPGRAAGVLREALALSHGPPLADFAYEAFAQAEIGRLEEARVAVLEDRVDADLALGNHAALVGELEALAREHPRRERLQRQLMLALYRSGRQADALERYRQARQRLVEDLGLEPGRELEELERAILAHDPALEAPARPTLPERVVSRARVGRGGLLIAGGGLALLAVAVAAAAISSGGGSPTSVAPNSVAVIDAGTDKLTGDVPVGAQPTAVSAGEGGIWVANGGDASASWIDTRTRRVSATIAPGGAVDGMAAGAGAVWTSDVARGALARIDPALRRVDRSIAIGRAPPSESAGGPVATGAGSVWVGTGQGKVARVDPKRPAVAARITVGNDPSAIAVGEGAVWVADDNDDTVARIDPATAGVLATIAVGRGASAIAAGEGAVWVAEPFDNAIARIDPKTNSITDTIPVGSAPSGVALGAGAVWVANSGDGTVSRVDPRTRGVTATISVGGSPHSAAIANGSLWVSVEPAPASAAAAGGAADTARVYAEGQLFGSTGPGSTDPALADPSPAIYATCGQLLNYPDKPLPAGARPRPEIARAMPEVSDGGRRYTYRLRPGFRFSPPSDQPVTAAAFRRAIERSLDPRMRSYARTLMRDVVGFHAYEAGRTSHLAGVRATGNALTITLTAPSPTFPARLAESYFCAVPPDTPVDPAGLARIPSAGPYYVASQDSNSGLVLKRNPAYAGRRPRHFAEIDILRPVAQPQAIADVEAGSADASNLIPGQSGIARIEGEYGPHGSRAGAGPPRFLSSPTLSLHYLVLNTKRPLFSAPRLRRAANYAVDRRALARQPLPHVSGHPTDQYIPQHMPGFRDAIVYPLDGPEVAKARRLAGGRGGRAVMYTCNESSCLHNAEVVRANLKAIGIDVRIRQFPFEVLYRKLRAPALSGGVGRWDIADVGWFADYADPYDILNQLFETVPGLQGGNFNVGHFDEPRFERRLHRAASLSGPRRYRTYARLDADLAREAAPVVAYANETSNYFFSERIGCEIVQPLYGLDLAALCERP